MLMIEGEVIVSDKFSMPKEEGGKTFMIKIEEVGLNKTVIVEQSLFEELPSQAELKARSLMDPVRIKVKGALKSGNKGWQPVLTEMDRLSGDTFIPSRRRTGDSSAPKADAA